MKNNNMLIDIYNILNAVKRARIFGDEVISKIFGFL